MKNPARTKRPRGRTPSGRTSHLPCKEHLKGTCTNPSCEKWHSTECLFFKTKEGRKFGEKCSYAHRWVDEQPFKKSQKNGGKSSVAVRFCTMMPGRFPGMVPGIKMWHPSVSSSSSLRKVSCRSIALHNIVILAQARRGSKLSSARPARFHVTVRNGTWRFRAVTFLISFL